MNEFETPKPPADVILPGDDPDAILDEDGNVVARYEESGAAGHMRMLAPTDRQAPAPGTDPLFAPAPPARDHKADMAGAHARHVAEVKRNFARTLRGKGYL